MNIKNYSIIMVDQSGCAHSEVFCTGYCAQHALESALDNGTVNLYDFHGYALVKDDTRANGPVFKIVMCLLSFPHFVSIP
jgi:hypothetical protein